MKFKFGDIVKLDKVTRFDWQTQGFYSNQTGIVVYVEQLINGDFVYDVKINHGILVRMAKEEHLEFNLAEGVTVK
jgi:hypothetical protein